MSDREAQLFEQSHQNEDNASLSSNSFEELNDSDGSQWMEGNHDVQNHQIATQNSTQTIDIETCIQQGVQTQSDDLQLLRCLTDKLKEAQIQTSLCLTKHSQLKTQHTLQQEENLKLKHNVTLIQKKLKQSQNLYEKVLEENKMFVEKIVTLKQQLEYQNDSMGLELKKYKELLEMVVGNVLINKQPVRIMKYIQTKNQNDKKLFRMIEHIYLKITHNKQGKMLITKIDIADQIQKLDKIHEYCSKLENQITVLKEQTDKNTDDRSTKSGGEKGFVERFLQPMSLFYKNQTPKRNLQSKDHL